jgi:hypothetical protein
MPMPALVSLMPMPSYAVQSGRSKRAVTLYFPADKNWAEIGTKSTNKYQYSTKVRKGLGELTLTIQMYVICVQQNYIQKDKPYCFCYIKTVLPIGRIFRTVVTVLTILY